MLDNIESNLAEANDYLEKAESHLESAMNQHKTNRGKMCWILLCLIVVCVPLLLYLLGVF